MHRAKITKIACSVVFILYTVFRDSINGIFYISLTLGFFFITKHFKLSIKNDISVQMFSEGLLNINAGNARFLPCARKTRQRKAQPSNCPQKGNSAPAIQQRGLFDGLSPLDQANPIGFTSDISYRNVKIR